MECRNLLEIETFIFSRFLGLSGKNVNSHAATEILSEMETKMTENAARVVSRKISVEQLLLPRRRIFSRFLPLFWSRVMLGVVSSKAGHAALLFVKNLFLKDHPAMLKIATATPDRKVASCPIAPLLFKLALYFALQNNVRQWTWTLSDDASSKTNQ